MNIFRVNTARLVFIILIITGFGGCIRKNNGKSSRDANREVLLGNDLALDAYDFIISARREEPVLLSDIIRLLGFPGECTHQILQRDVNSNINRRNGRLHLSYNNGSVSLQINVMGEPVSIFGGRHTGTSLPAWLSAGKAPDEVKKIDENNILGEKLDTKIRTIFGPKRNAKWWNELLERYRYPTTITNQANILAPLNHDVVQADFPDDDLAMIVFRIVDDSDVAYFIDTWWHLVEGEWRQISVREMCKQLEKKHRESRYDLIEADKLGYGVLSRSLEDMKSEYTNSDGSVTISYPKRIEIDENSDTIAAKLETFFGITYKIENLPPSTKIVLSKIVEHPPIRNPDGSVVKGYKYFETPTTSPEGTLNAWTGFRFDHEYELVTGSWTMILRYRGKELFMQNFTVVDE